MGLLDAARQVAQFLEQRRIPHAWIGGLALQHWGEPRLTYDADVTVLVPDDLMETFVDELLARFRPRIRDAREFALSYRVVLIEVEGVPVDVSLGLPGYEEEALRRAVPISFADGTLLRLLSAEDLVVHKCVAGRPRDLEDVSSILHRQQFRVDIPYIREWLSAFREVVEDHDPLALFERCLHEASRSAQEQLG